MTSPLAMTLRGYAGCAPSLMRPHLAAAADAVEELSKLRAERDARDDVLRRHGFVECDSPACNCGSWHPRYGLQERWNDLKDELIDAGVLNNSTGNQPLAGIRKLRTERDEARADAARYRWLTRTYAAGSRRIWNHVLDAEVRGAHETLNAAIDAALKDAK